MAKNFNFLFLMFTMSTIFVACNSKSDPQLSPVITTTSATSITSSTALSGGNITSNGGADVVISGVCWSTTTNPTIADNKTMSTASTTFTSNITGLTASTTYYARAYATNSVGISYGNEIIFTTSAETVTDIDGNVYKTIKIGNQTWMAENLKSIHFRNGDPIKNVTNDSEWANSNSEAYCWYNNDILNKVTYGALYNGYAVKDSRNIAPLGWHVATIDEWSMLISYLGGVSVAGGKMKEKGTTHWDSPNSDATNESGFNALPGGWRTKGTGAFQYKGSTGFYRTSSEELNSGYDSLWHIMLFNQNANITTSYSVKDYGFSVRCIKD